MSSPHDPHDPDLEIPVEVLTDDNRQLVMLAHAVQLLTEDLSHDGLVSVTRLSRGEWEIRVLHVDRPGWATFRLTLERKSP